MRKNVGSRFLILGALLLACAMVGGCGKWGGMSKEDRAEQALKNGDLNTASVQLRNLITEDPKSGATRLMLARVQILRAEWDSAAASLEEARQRDADKHAVAELYALLKVESGQYQDLLVQIDKGSSGLVGPWLSLYKGRALLGLGQIPEALLYLESGEGQAEVAALNLVYSAQAHAAFGRWNIAQQQLDLALKADPESPLVWLHSGMLKLREREFDAARSALRNAAKKAGSQLTLRERSFAFAAEIGLALDQGDVAAAHRIHEELLVLSPQGVLTSLLRAEISLAENDNAAALATLQRLVQQVPDQASVREAMVSALLVSGNLELAIQQAGGLQPQLQMAIKSAASAHQPERSIALSQVLMMLSQPRSAQMLIEREIKQLGARLPLAATLTQILLRRGQLERALSEAKQLAKEWPNEALAQSLLAQAQAANHDMAAAASSFEVAWKLSPNAATAVNLALGRNQSSQGQPLQSLFEWLGKHPDDVAVRLVLAELQSKAGQEDAAVASYQRLLVDQPRHPVALNNLALIYQRRGDRRSLETAKRAYEVARGSAQIADTYGWILYSSGNAPDAVGILEEAVRLNPVDPAIRYHLGAALARRGASADRGKARLWLSDLLRDPSHFEGRPDAERMLSTM